MARKNQARIVEEVRRSKRIAEQNSRRNLQNDDEVIVPPTVAPVKKRAKRLTKDEERELLLKEVLRLHREKAKKDEQAQKEYMKALRKNNEDYERGVIAAFKKRMTKPVFSCAQCEKTYVTQGNLRNHVRSKHPEGDEDEDDDDNGLPSVPDLKPCFVVLQRLPQPQDDDEEDEEDPPSPEEPEEEEKHDDGEDDEDEDDDDVDDMPSLKGTKRFREECDDDVADDYDDAPSMSPQPGPSRRPDYDPAWWQRKGIRDNAMVMEDESYALQLQQQFWEEEEEMMARDEECARQIQEEEYRQEEKRKKAEEEVGGPRKRRRVYEKETEFADFVEELFANMKKHKEEKKKREKEARKEKGGRRK